MKKIGGKIDGKIGEKIGEKIRGKSVERIGGKIGGKISISDPHTTTFSKIWHMFCLCATLTEAVFVYFVVCLCIYVFVICASDTLEYCFFEVLVPLPFQKYSIC